MKGNFCPRCTCQPWKGDWVPRNDHLDLRSLVQFTVSWFLLGSFAPYIYINWSLMMSVCSSPAAGVHLHQMGLQPEIVFRWQSKTLSPSCCRNASYGIISSWMLATCLMPKQNESRDSSPAPGRKISELPKLGRFANHPSTHNLTIKEH